MLKIFNNYCYALAAFLMTSPLFAQTAVEDIIVGAGNDGTAKLSIINTVIQTGQRTILYGIGPLGGSWLIYKGFQMIGNAERGDKMPGVITMISGAACFLIGPIIANLIDAAQA